MQNTTHTGLRGRLTLIVTPRDQRRRTMKSHIGLYSPVREGRGWIPGGECSSGVAELPLGTRFLQGARRA
jgi:hypothetical protein